MSTRTVVATYRPLDDVLSPAEIALYRNWELRSIDFYFEDTTRLLATYECFLIADDTRRVVLVVYNTLNPTVGIRYIIALPNPFRVGGAKTVRLRGTDDIIAISGPFPSYYDITPSNPSKPEFLKRATSDYYTPGSTNAKLSDSYTV